MGPKHSSSAQAFCAYPAPPTCWTIPLFTLRATRGRTMAKDLQASLEELIRRRAAQKINRKQYISDSIGEYTIEDILKELEKPGRDPCADRRISF